MNDKDSIARIAKRDAKRYYEAKMNYGKGAGNRRKILDAEIKAKMKDHNYEVEFHKALSQIDPGEVAQKIEKRKAVQKTYSGVKKAVRTARRIDNFVTRNEGLFTDILRWMFGK